jgi:hypothetical protein
LWRATVISRRATFLCLLDGAEARDAGRDGLISRDVRERAQPLKPLENPRLSGFEPQRTASILERPKSFHSHPR